MAQCFCKEGEPLLVPAIPKTFKEGLGDALCDLRSSGLDQLDEIAEFYNINPMLLLRRYHGHQLSR